MRKISSLVVITIVALTLSPMLFLWVVNSLAEAGGSNFYIAHTLWSYWLAFIFMLCVRGGTK